jgi:hypothetical protein
MESRFFLIEWTSNDTIDQLALQDCLLQFILLFGGKVENVYFCPPDKTGSRVSQVLRGMHVSGGSSAR